VKVAYWPGCVSRGFTPELHGSMAKIAPLLDIELVELDRANCCGAGVIAEHNQELADTLNARTFALAQQVEGADMMMNICSTCQGAQSEAQERLDANTEYRDHVNETLAGEGLHYDKPITNKHFLWLMVEEIGLDKVASMVKRPLTDLRVGPFYGCYIVRPTKRLGYADHPERDRYMEMVIEAIGGTPATTEGDQSITDVGLTTWRLSPSSFGSSPNARPTIWGRCRMGMPSGRPTTFSASGCCRSRLRWHRGQGVTRQSASASIASPRWRPACLSEASLFMVMIGNPQHLYWPA
jgi:heterodisulfide reductase subunit B